MTPRPARAKRPKTGGRKKGTPNKATARMREAMVSVFLDLQAGTGAKTGHLRAWAHGNARDFYRLASRLLPGQATGQGGGPVVARIELVGFGPEEKASE